MRLRIVMLLVIAPLFGLAGYLVASDVLRQQGEASLARQASAVATEGALVGALVHELQKERGFSAGFLASGGARFADDLAQQRAASTSAIASLWSDLSVLLDKRPGEVAQIRARLRDLDDMRGQVDSFALNVPAMAAFYTGAINLLIDISRPIAAASAQGEMSALLTARATDARGLWVAVVPGALLSHGYDALKATLADAARGLGGDGAEGRREFSAQNLSKAAWAFA
ncbi:MAG: nitrate- and nitrite sensing domain-containing protein, partial [Pseudomonadota bacterium]